MTISEVSKKFDITPDTLRYYERIGLIPPVPRSKSGLRDYDDESCRWIEFIKCMRSAGLPIEALSEYVTLFRQGNRTIEERRRLLIRERDILSQKISDMQETLKRLDYKISFYEKTMEENKCESLLNKKDG